MIVNYNNLINIDCFYGFYKIFDGILKNLIDENPVVNNDIECYKFDQCFQTRFINDFRSIILLQKKWNRFSMDFELVEDWYGMMVFYLSNMENNKINSIYSFIYLLKNISNSDHLQILNSLDNKKITINNNQYTIINQVNNNDASLNYLIITIQSYLKNTNNCQKYNFIDYLTNISIENNLDFIKMIIKDYWWTIYDIYTKGYKEQQEQQEHINNMVVFRNVKFYICDKIKYLMNLIGSNMNLTFEEIEIIIDKYYNENYPQIIN